MTQILLIGGRNDFANTFVGIVTNTQPAVTALRSRGRSLHQPRHSRLEAQSRAQDTFIIFSRGLRVINKIIVEIRISNIRIDLKLRHSHFAIKIPLAVT